MPVFLFLKNFFLIWANILFCLFANLFVYKESLKKNVVAHSLQTIWRFQLQWQRKTVTKLKGTKVKAGQLFKESTYLQPDLSSAK